MVVDGRVEAAPGAVAPTRSIDRTGMFSLGVRGGSFMSGYDDGPGYGDFGLGIAARYRLAEALGLEVSWLYHDQTWDESTERISQPLSASFELFAFPWARVSPYALAGVTWTNRNYDDEVTIRGATDEYRTDDVLFGPHGGVGIEFAVGQQASVNFEARAIGYMNQERDDCSTAGAVQATMGANFYF